MTARPDIPATPGQKRLEARVIAEEAEGPRVRKHGFPPKSNTRKAPTALQKRIDAALERERP